MTDDLERDPYEKFATNPRCHAPYHGLAAVVFLGISLLVSDRAVCILSGYAGWLFALSFAFHVLTLAATTLEGVGLKIFQITGALIIPICIAYWFHLTYGATSLNALISWIQDGEVFISLIIVAFFSFGFGRFIALDSLPFRSFIAASFFFAYVAVTVSDGPKETRLLTYLVPVAICYVVMLFGLYVEKYKECHRTEDKP